MNKRFGFKRNSSGAIEGLPLYLIIIIVITVIGLGIVLGMMNTVKPPTTLDKMTINPEELKVTDEDGDGEYDNFGNDDTVTIKVRDSNGDAVKGAIVRLSGSEVKDSTGNLYLKTDSNGEVIFREVECSLLSKDIGHIKVEVEKSGLGKLTGQIVVIPVG